MSRQPSSLSMDPPPVRPESSNRDPVCGMTISEESSYGIVKHEGEIYLFCSERCMHEFDAAPDRFLGGAEPQTGGPPGARYTCPMHPEIVQDSPGSCPKCGMALEPDTASPKEEANPEYDSMRKRLIFAAILALPLLINCYAGYAPRWPSR